MEAASSVQHKDKMVDGSGSLPPRSCVVANLLIFLKKNYGRGTKTIFLCEVIKPVLSPKKQEKSIA